MISTPSNFDELDCGLLLIAHLICADGQIHIEEAKALQFLSDKAKPNEATQAALNGILTECSEAPSIQELIEDISPTQQTKVFKQLCEIAFVDGCLSSTEERLIRRSAKAWNIPDENVNALLSVGHALLTELHSTAAIEEDNLSKVALLLENTKSKSRAAVRRLTAIAPKPLSHYIHKIEQKILLSGPEYGRAVSNCAKVAKWDYKFTRARLNSADETLGQLRQDLQDVLSQLSTQANQGKNGEMLVEVIDCLDSTRQVLDQKILQELEALQSALESRHRSLNHFTIAFMGKTKAGKSTLHSVIIGEGWEGIGVGMQRTTRCNRVYEWKNIRIIDTPGIGAPGGEDDESVARSVIDESDVICYVVTDDSIQASEFEFMKVLKEHSKPLIVLLNIQKNLTDSQRLEHFLKNPDKLFSKEKNGVDGHVNRIRRYAQEHYSNSYFPVIPVMLLAAQMSRQEEDKEQADRLLKASRINDFLYALRFSIVEYGSIRRSQTLLGSTVYSVEKPLHWISEQAEAYQAQSEAIDKRRDRLKKEFQEALIDTQAELTTEIQIIFAELNQSTDVFALEHWEWAEKDIQKAWEAKLKSHRLRDRLKTTVEVARSNLEKRTRSALEEINAELQLLADFNLDSTNFTGANQNFYEKYKELIALGGAVIGLLAFAPPLASFALFLGGVGAAISFFAGMLKSKSERQSEAVGHIKTQLKKQLSANEKKVLDHTHQQLEKCSQTITTSVDDYFKCISGGTNQISSCLQKREEDLRGIVDDLNEEYAHRILKWATGKPQEIASVERDFGKKMQIWTKYSDTKNALRRNAEELSQVLQEEIVIH